MPQLQDTMAGRKFLEERKPLSTTNQSLLTIFRGQKVNQKRVHRIMKELGLKCIVSI